MKKWIARSAVGLTVLVSGAGAAFMVLADMGDRKLDAPHRRRRRAGARSAATPRASSAARYLFSSRGCGDCHGADGAGHVVVDDGKGLLRPRAQHHAGAERRRPPATRRPTGCAPSATASSPTAGR